MIQAPNAHNLPLPSIALSKLLALGDIGNTPNKVAPAKDSHATSSSSRKHSSKSKKKKASLKAMALLESSSNSDDDDDTSSKAFSVAAFDPQRDYFGNSDFNSQEYVLESKTFEMLTTESQFFCRQSSC